MVINYKIYSYFLLDPSPFINIFYKITYGEHLGRAGGRSPPRKTSIKEIYKMF